MSEPIILRGRLLDSRHIELDEPISNITGRIEISIRPIALDDQGVPVDVLDFIESLPPGTRTKEDIDKQIKEERDSWGDR